MTIGFSTGALAKGDFKDALRMLEDIPDIKAIELSALRETELPILIEEIPKLNLTKFDYISIHAPSKLLTFSEKEVVDLLMQIVRLNIHIIVHPDIINDFSEWRKLGYHLCIENMDKRKPIGRTTEDLDSIFDQLPDAKLCMDLAHAKQVDPSMIESVKMLRKFSNRIIQFHISDVSSDSSHIPINIEAILSFRKIENLILSINVPFIVESPVNETYISKEVKFIRSIFSTEQDHKRHINPFLREDVYHDESKEKL